MKGMMLLPPRPDVCQQCAVDHESKYPHDQTSLFWQYWFFGQHDRWPLEWIEALKDHGINLEGGEHDDQKTTDPQHGKSSAAD